jgi:integrase
MGRMNKLTAAKVKAVKADKPWATSYGDGGGLWLRVSATGNKSWVFRFTLAGKHREMGLGTESLVSLADARQKAEACRRLLLENLDPIEQRLSTKQKKDAARAKALTFDQCVAAYIEAHRSGWKNAKHVSQWENTLATYASPIIGALPVAEIDTGLVVKVLAPIWTTKTETATRLRGRIESILGWATVLGHRHGDNPARWKGHLDNLLANINKNERTQHHAALPWREIGAFMAQLRGQAGIGARAVEFAILTACRSGEVRLVTWAEIDLGAAQWTIPAGRMKAGREHRVPLSKEAVTLLQNMPRMGDLVFPGRDMGKPLSDMSLTAVLRRMDRGDITVHGFRSTFRDWAAESTNFPREVCEHALAHSLPDKVEAAYRRGDLLEKRILLMQAWASYCDTLPALASVTPIRGAAA